MKIKKRKKERAIGERIFYAISTLTLLFVLVIVAYPIIYVVSASLSSYNALSAGRVLLWPVELSLAGYKFVFNYEMVWTGYRNTLIYTLFGVLTTLTLTIFCAYPLSKREYQGRGFFTMVFLITMMFHAGMIPTFLVYVNLGLYDSPLAVILSGALGMGNVFIMRTAFQSVPDELWEAAEIDGANYYRQFFMIGLPLTKATIGVLFLYSAVGCWNDYFNAMIYLTDSDMFPLQLVLRTILTAAQSLDLSSVSDSAMLAMANNGTEQVKYALIVVSTVPVLALYGLVQRCFKSGVMIGAVKG